MNTYAEILAAFNDITRDSANFHFSAAQKDRFANRALRAACERTKYLFESNTVQASSGIYEYSADVEAYSIERIEYDGEVLLPIEKAQLRYADRNWEDKTGTPKYYYLDELYQSNPAYPYFGVYEAPNTSATEFTVWITPYPTTLVNTSGSAEIEIPDWCVGLVLYYMLYLAYRADTQIKNKNKNTSAFYKVLYDMHLERLQVRAYTANPVESIVSGTSRVNVSVLNRLPDGITE